MWDWFKSFILAVCLIAWMIFCTLRPRNHDSEQWTQDE